MSHALKTFVRESSKWGDLKMNFKSSAIFRSVYIISTLNLLDTPKYYYFFAQKKGKNEKTHVVMCDAYTPILHTDLYNFSGQFNRFIHDMYLSGSIHLHTYTILIVWVGFLLTFYGCTFLLLSFSFSSFRSCSFLALRLFFIHYVKMSTSIQRWRIDKINRTLSLWFF